MILTFSILIVIIFLMEIGMGVAGYIKHGELAGILTREFNKTLEKYDRLEYQDTWKLIQTELKCCGVMGSDDWYQVFHKSTLPVSCCSQLPLDESCTAKYAHQTGCSDKLLNVLKENAVILAGVATAVAVVQPLAIVFACCLYPSFSRNYETV